MLYDVVLRASLSAASYDTCTMLNKDHSVLFFCNKKPFLGVVCPALGSWHFCWRGGMSHIMCYDILCVVTCVDILCVVTGDIFCVF